MMEELTFRAIAYGTAAYLEECRLRDDILRRPIGLSLWDEDLSMERRQLHFGLYADETLTACVIAVLETPTAAKIRQMAVAEKHQRQGLGRLIMTCLEAHLAQLGITELSLHARVSVSEFYEKLGYATTGPLFTEVGIPHIKMVKQTATP